MHVPDGFLDARTSLITGGLAVAGLAVALRQARTQLPPRRVPLLGLAAAFVFAAQMINFPVAGGTSGHLMGAVLVAVLLGPSVAVIVMSAVLIVQSLLFADGGVTALGANVLNMGILAGVGGWGVYRLVTLSVGGHFGRILGATFAAWCGAVLAALACAGELAVSRTVAWSLVLPAMGGIHMIIGLGEGLITALVLTGIARTRPDLLDPEPGAEPNRSYVAVVAFGFLIALSLALFVSPLASRWPDGLDHTAEVLGFADKADPALVAPMPEYEMPGFSSSVAATSAAGAVGTLVVFGFAWTVARVLVPKGQRIPPSRRRPEG